MFTALFVAWCTVLGLIVGSFLNVVIHRVPRGESVVSPPSACPGCGHRIKPYDNVPVLSWLLLRGRCRACAQPISPRYPLVEAGTAAAFGLTAWWWGLSWELPAFLYLAAVAVALALIDIDVKRLPDAIVLPSYLACALLLALAAAGTGEPARLIRAGLGGLAGYGLLFAIRVVKPAGMGLGDVKLMGVLGLYLGYLGWSQFVVGFFAAFLVGGVAGVFLLLFTTAGRKARIPFGPYLLLGAYLGLLVGSPVAQWYLALTGLSVS
ncbi:MAG: prepilin peptidase [Micrococcales bacterium]|nr:MAG: prepilin peptidase [Micrococcales bacterium]PIE26752.1 MAG: prepilin peptidase [Micrococcales bacterium]